MADERIQRKLAAIVAADVVGYSTLMGRDESGTLARLKALRAEFLHPKIAEYGGRIVKITGDGTLIEFPSAVDAVQHAIDVQRGMAQRNAALTGAPPIQLRLGINLGDVIIDGDDIYGDGVNVAARLEGLAEPGGICISATVHAQVRNKVDAAFDDLGQQTVKNISEPVHVFRAALGTQAATATASTAVASRRESRPAIAVLPFANMSADAEQEYFADGMVEDIITCLSRIRWLTVIARNSTFAYKGTAPDIRKVGRELDVRYVLEGSVRKSGERVRITAQLIDAETGGHLWADRFDGALADVFDLQDRITAGVVAAIEPSVLQAEIERAKRKRPDNLDAYDLYLRALEHAYDFTPSGHEAALALLESALAIDPSYAEAHGLAAFCLQARYLWGGRVPQDRTAALRHADALAATRTDDATTLAFAALVKTGLGGNYGDALALAEQALTRNPSSAPAHSVISVLYSRMGQYDQCLSHAESALRLSPFDPMRYVPETAAASAKLAAGEYEGALAGIRRALLANPAFVPARVLETACLVRLKRLDEAKEGVRRLLDISPDTNLGNLRESFLATDDRVFADIIADLRAVGLPE